MSSVIFKLPDGSKKKFEANEGETVLELIKRNDLNYVQGLCGGCLACSTCHIIVDSKWFESVEKENKLSDEESDMLDFATDLCDHSRLGCCVKITKNIDGVEFIVPNMPEV